MSLALFRQFKRQNTAVNLEFKNIHYKYQTSGNSSNKQYLTISYNRNTNEYLLESLVGKQIDHIRQNKNKIYK